MSRIFGSKCSAVLGATAAGSLESSTQAPITGLLWVGGASSDLDSVMTLGAESVRSAPYAT